MNTVAWLILWVAVVGWTVWRWPRLKHHQKVLFLTAVAASLFVFWSKFTQ